MADAKDKAAFDATAAAGFAWAFTKPSALEVVKKVKTGPRPNLNGKLYCTAWGGTVVYLIDQGFRRGFPGAEVFYRLYQSYPTRELVEEEPLIDEVPLHPVNAVIPSDAALIVQEGGGTVFLVDRWDGGPLVKRGIPSWEIFWDIYKFRKIDEVPPILMPPHTGPNLDGRA